MFGCYGSIFSPQRKLSSMLMECVLPKVLFGHLRNLTLIVILLILLLLTLQPWVGLGLFNNSIPFLSVLYLRPPTNNFRPL